MAARLPAVGSTDTPFAVTPFGDQPLQLLLDNVPIVVYRLRAKDASFTYLNEALQLLTGWSPAEWLGESFLRLIDPADQQRAARFLDHVRGGEAPFPCELRVLSQSGQYLLMEFQGQPQREDGVVTGICGVARDVSRHKARDAQAAPQAFHDPLTGLPNRAYFLDRLERALAQAERRQGVVAVLFIDVDRFKQVNDSYGHQVGDELLVALAERLRVSVRAADTAARLGGDEFTILMEDAGGVGAAIRLAERILKALAAPFALGRHDALVTASIGIALSRDGDATRQAPLGALELLRNADAAMYRAKANRRGRFEVFDAGMSQQAIDQLTLASDLRRALERRELRVSYQPQVCLATGAIVALAAQLRWRHPHRGILRAEDFLPLTEQAGLAVPISRWLLTEACRQARRWHDQNLLEPPLSVVIEVSPQHMRRPDFLTDVRAALPASELPRRQIAVAVGETEVAHDVEQHADRLGELRRHGLAVGLTRLGAGGVPLGALRQLPLDFAEIDPPFVVRIGRDPVDRAVVSALVDVVHAHGANVVAGGVDSVEQANRLRALGCDVAQGALFHPSLSAAEAATLLRARGARSTHRATRTADGPLMLG